jgi:hypothetical protein
MASEVRKSLMDALRLDLVGPQDGLGNPEEILPEPPSRWYLTGFIVPIDADETEKSDEAGTDELDQVNDAKGLDDAVAPDTAAARRSFFPSSVGLSLLVNESTRNLRVQVRWGDYRPERAGVAGAAPFFHWRRIPRQELIELTIPGQTEKPVETEVPNSAKLKIALSVRPVQSDGKEGGIPRGTRSVSLFLVNRRQPAPDEQRDTAWAFQAQLEVHADDSFVPRPNLRSLESEDWDERIADLQYRDDCEFAVGHNISTEADESDCACRLVRTCWMPTAEVQRVAPSPIGGVELSMEALSRLADGREAQAKLEPFVSQYRSWIDGQKGKVPQAPRKRMETGELLLQRAQVAAGRIEKGIALLADPACLEAFRIANRVMAAAARQRQSALEGKDPAAIKPAWRPFQLAFILMNLTGIADPNHADREVVDLLFFPTGGGKTEAYLGLAAFTLVLRRLRNPGVTSAGLAVLMRYTLRLLTLDQLSRAATLICALELERQNDVDKLGPWPFEIGLWVGKAATPNRMGAKGDNDRESARAKTIAFKNDDRKPSPIPLENCPWCDTRFKATSFNLLPNQDFPTDLRITCANRNCAFTRDRPLPILAVDEPIYRRLPCFMIATVDKFAAMPWTGEVGAFFGRVQRFDKNGFYGPCDPATGQPLPGQRLLAPELIIQDELHLISGPLGTMVGLYKTALDELATRDVGPVSNRPEAGQVTNLPHGRVRPKIIASTATVRRAENQIRALFNRRQVDIFPPPGPDRRDSFFAEVHSAEQSNPRVYVGIAAQGRSPKVIMLKTYLALLGAGQKAYTRGGKPSLANPADPYMTLLGYFNSLRELGGARRLIEDEVGNRLMGYASRKRVGEAEAPFDNRKIATDVVELTSRVGTDKVADAKRRLQLAFSDKQRVDVAIATNMISVGLDIVRLGLMVVYGQPKTSAEYIQATSRVGRDHERPGLVVTILNIHKPRDRSHYERFAAYHQSFYRSVEATSVTPFSPRALDRGLAGTLVGLARQGYGPMTPPRGAGEILRERPNLDFAVNSLAERARTHARMTPEEAEKLRQEVRLRAIDLLEEWNKIAIDLSRAGVALQYQAETGAAQRLLYEFLNPELKRLPPRHKKFRANRSLRDVEPSVNLWLKTMDGTDLEEDEE